MAVNEEQLVDLPRECVQGKFLLRIKRFSIEFELESDVAWAHTNNSGAMLGLLRPGNSAIFSRATNPRRQNPYTFERIWVGDEQKGFWVNVNTMLANRLFAASFHARRLDFCSEYQLLKAEMKREESRFDFCLEGASQPVLWVECKSVTLVEDDIAYFPDAPSARARKHLLELIRVVKSGARGAMFYLVQRPDCKCLEPADFIDSEYTRIFAEAYAAGVEMYAYRTQIFPDGYGLGEALPVKFH